jgi:transcriptional regulator with XRE-family HTH domain
MIGSNIRNIRKSKGISQAELAAILGVQQSFISKLELDKNTPTLPQIIQIKKKLKCQYDELIEGKKHSDKKPIKTR